MSRQFKNFMRHGNTPDPIEERENLAKEVLNNSTLIPKTLNYKDIDIAFKEWVENGLNISYEGKKLETIALFSSQRFSEYMQTWSNTDVNRNLLLNFKVVTRENNPMQGTNQGKNFNIPGNPTFLLKRFTMVDRNNRPYYQDVRVRQPLCVDLMYSVNIVTNKYELLNEFNRLVNDKFKSIQCYISPNGYYLPMKLESISDESEYNLNDRKFFSQTFEISVAAYILTEDDFIVEEVPMVRLTCINDGTSEIQGMSDVELEETDKIIVRENDSNEYDGYDLKIYLYGAQNKVSFSVPMNLMIYNVLSDNILSYKVYINRSEIKNIINFQIKEGDEVLIKSVKKKSLIDKEGNPSKSSIVFETYKVEK